MITPMDTPSRISRKLLPIAASAAIVVGGIGLGACGGDDSTDATTAAGPLDQTELAAQADALCTDADEALTSRDDVPDFGQDGLQSQELQDASSYFQASADEQENLYSELSSLEPDEKVASDWDDFLEMYRTAVVDLAGDLAEQAAKGDQEAFFKIALDNQKAVQELAVTAGELGMTACGASDAESAEA